MPSHHGAHYEAIFVHEVQAPKRGRNFGATYQQSVRRRLLQRLHRAGQVPFGVMRVVPREVAARRLKMMGLSDPLRNEPRLQSIERTPGVIPTRKAQRVLVQPAP